MRVGLFRITPAIAFCLAAVALVTPVGAVAVSFDMTALRVMQPFAEKKEASDQAYVVVTGVAKGKALDAAKLPKGETWTVARKKALDASDKKPVVLWAGDLADGEFAAVTVTLFQGKGDEAKTKEFTSKLTDAEKKAAGVTAPKIAKPEDQVKLATDLLAAHREVITGIKDMFSREKKSDHYGGQFTIIIWNNGGKIANRLDPVGLTFGEHYGKKEKIYTKIKNTRQNVMVPDETGELGEKILNALDDEETSLRVKMLEAEPKGDDEFKVCDYLADVQVRAEGKAIPWSLGGFKAGVDDIHVYWNFATNKGEKKK